MSASNPSIHHPSFVFRQPKRNDILRGSSKAFYFVINQGRTPRSPVV